MRSPESREPRSNLRGIEVAVDLRATVLLRPAPGGRGLPKAKASFGQVTQEIKCSTASRRRLPGAVAALVKAWGFPLVPKLHLETHLSAQLHCPLPFRSELP